MKSGSILPKIIAPEPNGRLSSPSSPIIFNPKKKPLKAMHISTDQDPLFLKEVVDTKMLGPSTVGSMGPSSLENNNKSISFLHSGMRISPISNFKTPMGRNSSQKTLSISEFNSGSGVKLSRRASVGRFSETQLLLDEIINTPELIETEVNGKASRLWLEPSNKYKAKLSLINHYDQRMTSVVDDPRADLIKNNNALLDTLKNLKYIPKDKINLLQPDDPELVKKIDKILSDGYSIHKQHERVDRDIGLSENVWNSVDVENSKYTFLNFECRAENFPLKIAIKTEEDISRVKTYISFTNNKPNNLNFDYNFENKNFKFAQKKKSKDLNEYVSVYFAMMADGTGRIGVRVEMIEREGDPKRKDLLAKMHRRARSEMNPFELAELEAEIKLIKDEKMRKLVSLAGGKNHMAVNRDVTKFEPKFARQRRELLNKKKSDLIQSAFEKRLFLEAEEQEKKKLAFYGTEFAKVLREYILEKEREKKLKQKWTQKWLKFLLMEKVCHELVLTVKIEKEKRDARRKMAAHIAAFKTCTRIKLRLKGANLNERIINDTRMSFQNLALFFKPYAKRDATKCIAKFLEKTKPVYFLHKSFMSLVNTSARVQRAWRAFKKKKNEFRVVLNDFWEKYYLQVYNDPANQILFEATNTKLHGEELKNDEIGKRKFMHELFASCVQKYITNLSFTRLEWLGQSSEDRKKSYVARKWMAVNQKRIEQEKLLQMQQQGTAPQSIKKKKKTNIEDLQEDPESPKKNSTLRLFVLPPMAELLELLKKAIVAQKSAKYL